MAKIRDAIGNDWTVYLGEDAPHPGVLPLIFHCTSNPSWGWRVVEVPEDEWGGGRSVDDLSDQDLQALFDRAQPFDYAHDPKSRENTVGETPLR